MAKSIKFKDVDSLPEDARYREGNHGEVDIYDEKFQSFLRVDEGDKIEEFGNGYTIVKSEK